MELFNVGIGELLVILVIMYVLLGPKGMLQAAHWLGQASRQMMRFFNETWRSITDVPMDIRDLPRSLLEETGLRETFDEIQQETRSVRVDLDKTLGDVNNKIGGGRVATAKDRPSGKREPAQQQAAKELPEPANAERLLPEGQPRAAAGTVEASVYADKYRREAEQSPDGEPPKRKRGRPRKDEPRPEPPPPRKRGRPRKVRPEAAAQDRAVAQDIAAAQPPKAKAEEPPVKERPSEPPAKLPRQTPSQPGDPVMPLDQDAATGEREPPPSKNPTPRHPDAPAPAEENPDNHG